MNWYIIFSQTEKQSQLCNLLCQEGLHAFLPMMEYYRRDWKKLAKKPMFPGYIFVQSEMEQQEFDRLLDSMAGRRWGFIRQLKEEGESALNPAEEEFFQLILDDKGEAPMSYGYLNREGRAVITYGSLVGCEEQIQKVDKHNHLVYLNFTFRSQPIKLGLTLMTVKELKEKDLYPQELQKEQQNQSQKHTGKKSRTISLEDGIATIYDEDLAEEVEIDLKELISKMTQL